MLLLLLVPEAVVSQQLPKDISVALDSFTGDTIYETHYGGLDQPTGCGRLNLAIIWRWTENARTHKEILVYQYIDVEGPFSSGAKSFGAIEADLNIDGKFVHAERIAFTDRYNYDRTTKQESGSFVLPDSTLYRVAMSHESKLRLSGVNRTCGGIIEGNMRLRLRALLRYLALP